MRCKHGDLAVIVQDFPGCDGNLGVIVEVIGPPESHPDCELLCWLIRPVKRRKLWLVSEDGPLLEFISRKNQAMHPDAWLMPVGGDALVRCQGNAIPLQAAPSSSFA